MIEGFICFELQAGRGDPVETWAVRVPCVGEEIVDRENVLRTVTRITWQRDTDVRIKGEMPLVALVRAQ